MSRVIQNVRQSPILMALVVIVVIVGLGIVWWLGSPLFINNTVNEAFPIAVPTSLPVDSSQPLAETTAAAAAPDEQIAESAPIALVTGQFRDADSFHKGSGDASIYQLTDGSFILRLENFDVTNGPDLHVYLVKHADPTTSEEVNDGGYLDLGGIKGNQGAQNYAIATGTDLSQYKSVVIYCQPFHVVFSVAPLAVS